MSKRLNCPELNRMVGDQQERRCTHCRLWQPLTNFVWHSNYYGYCCKDCNRMAQRERRARKGIVPNGTGDLTRTMKGMLNRVREGVTERCCRKCDRWQPIEVFPMRQGNRKYRCHDCELVADRAYKRKRRETGRRQAKPLRPVVRAFLSFAKAPTPQQLMERRAAA